MPTRVKRPSILVKLGTTLGLVGFLGYLGYHVFTGAFGIESQKDMLDDIALLKARQAALQTEINSYRHRIALFDPQRLDPDMLTERAGVMLGLVAPDRVIIVPDDEITSF
ncbi:FtsB family cell division protein [Pelagibacterium limicola]|uniref:FtsB family cell division protein n=1 Tax=Pelagibacterium limicola TaxID=2791022 RepID=UPI0018AFD521|nr:septum formation initiator family protein [Pelagibacterium limicola]